MGKPEKKLSDMAHFELKDLTVIKILICYLIHQLNRAVEPDQLYEIAVGNNIINYFYYQEAVDDLLRTNHPSTDRAYTPVGYGIRKTSKEIK